MVFQRVQGTRVCVFYLSASKWQEKQSYEQTHHHHHQHQTVVTNVRIIPKRIGTYQRITLKYTQDNSDIGFINAYARSFVLLPLKFPSQYDICFIFIRYIAFK